MAAGNRKSFRFNALAWAFLLGALIVFPYRFLMCPVPGVDYVRLQSSFRRRRRRSFLTFLTFFSGGALSRASVMAMGIFPYITASIIMMLASYSIPTLEEMRKEGAAGPSSY